MIYAAKPEKQISIIEQPLSFLCKDREEKVKNKPYNNKGEFMSIKHNMCEEVCRMKKDKSDKISFVCFLTASICFYISAVFCFMSETTDNSTGIVNLCLGSAFLCLSSVYINKEKDKNNKDTK